MHTLIQRNQARIGFLNDPVDLRVGEMAQDIRHHRHVVHHIAQGRYADNQDFHVRVAQKDNFASGLAAKITRLNSA